MWRAWWLMSCLVRWRREAIWDWVSQGEVRSSVVKWGTESELNAEAAEDTEGDRVEEKGGVAVVKWGASWGGAADESVVK